MAKLYGYITKTTLIKILKEKSRAEVCNYLQISSRTLDRLIAKHHLTRENYGHKGLKDADVLEIRMTYASENIKQVELAERFGVSQALISKIINREVHRSIGSLRVSGAAKARISYGNKE